VLLIVQALVVSPIVQARIELLIVQALIALLNSSSTYSVTHS